MTIGPAGTSDKVGIGDHMTTEFGEYTTEEYLAPVRWLERPVQYENSAGFFVTKLVLVLQQQWCVHRWLAASVISPKPVLLGTTYEWRDVPTVTE